MQMYKDLTPLQQKEEFEKVSAAFAELKAKNLKLDMSRGKPGKAQLDMVSDILNVLVDPADCIADGLDARNYGELAGMPSAKELFADILGCQPEECFVGGRKIPAGAAMGMDVHHTGDDHAAIGIVHLYPRRGVDHVPAGQNGDAALHHQHRAVEKGTGNRIIDPRVADKTAVHMKSPFGRDMLSMSIL